MKELAVDGISVTVSCRVLKLARQPYYRWLARPVSSGELVRAYRANALFDAHRDDPLAQENLDEDDFVWVTQELLKIADKHSEGRVVSALEGGYNLDALGRSAAAHVRVLMA